MQRHLSLNKMYIPQNFSLEMCCNSSTSLSCFTTCIKASLLDTTKVLTRRVLNAGGTANHSRRSLRLPDAHSELLPSDTWWNQNEEDKKTLQISIDITFIKFLLCHYLQNECEYKCMRIVTYQKKLGGGRKRDCRFTQSRYNYHRNTIKRTKIRSQLAPKQCGHDSNWSINIM